MRAAISWAQKHDLVLGTWRAGPWEYSDCFPVGSAKPKKWKAKDSDKIRWYNSRKVRRRLCSVTGVCAARPRTSSFEKRAIDQAIQDSLAVQAEVEAHLSRMKERLRLFGLAERDVPGDGNCQFHALSDQLRAKSIVDMPHGEVRAVVVHWLRNTGASILVDDNPAVTLAAASGEGDWGAYCSMMERDKEWGDHLTLLAACMAFQVEVLLISSAETNWGRVLEICPLWKLEARTQIQIGHYHERHYISTGLASWNKEERDNLKYQDSASVDPKMIPNLTGPIAQANRPPSSAERIKAARAEDAVVLSTRSVFASTLSRASQDQQAEPATKARLGTRRSTAPSPL
eukprot:TRINITY_DN3604_c0_g1_i2.p1 TRINITY_DN3604_c0_g1~~TRINITY_DN3604_c0_g1_i2.p1  ORF type:complete len:344 (+),score=46.23 TRINITY_DN3604_c0_g1_i2:208-1239(+)